MCVAKGERDRDLKARLVDHYILIRQARQVALE
jgi:hypothetical protein